MFNPLNYDFSTANLSLLSVLVCLDMSSVSCAVVVVQRIEHLELFVSIVGHWIQGVLLLGEVHIVALESKSATISRHEGNPTGHDEEERLYGSVVFECGQGHTGHPSIVTITASLTEQIGMVGRRSREDRYITISCRSESSTH